MLTADGVAADQADPVRTGAPDGAPVDGEFFVQPDGGDQWNVDEDAAGRRRRLLEVAAIGTVVLAVLVTAALLYEGPVHHPSGPVAPATALAAQQGALDTIAVRHGCPVNPATPLHPGSFAGPAQVLLESARYSATVRTTAGSFRVALDAGLAPHTVNSFVFLAEAGFFTCNPFERVIKGALAMTGDPAGTGAGFPGYLVSAERPPVSHNPKAQYPLGSVVLANTGLLDAGGSQWFVVTGPKGESLPPSYTLFGHVTSGLAAAERISAEGTASGKPRLLQRVLSITIDAQGR
jgi:cyclophilin family peptidyl-prolyl cis-trans isomerase